MDLSLLKTINTDTLLSNILISQIITSIILITFIAKPLVIKRYALGDEFSNVLKEYYINNFNDGIIMDVLLSIVINFISVRSYILYSNYFNNQYNNLLSYLVINMFVIYIILSLIKNYILTSKSKSENITFFKDWVTTSKIPTIKWYLIYFLCTSLIFIFFIQNNFDFFNIILIICTCYFSNNLS